MNCFNLAALRDFLLSAPKIAAIKFRKEKGT